MRILPRWFTARSTEGQGKALSQMVHTMRRWLPGWLDALGDHGGINYRREVGSGLTSSVIMAPVAWMQRSLPEAPLVVERASRQADDGWDAVDTHPLATLLENPNPYYSGKKLLQATVLSYATDGNGYWIKVRNRSGQVGQLWYAPHWMIEPDWSEDGSDFIRRYKYTPGNEVIFLEPDDVVHFRHGLDPRNVRKGISPLDPALKEIFADGQAGEFIAALLRNNGIPGVVISPETDDVIEPQDVQMVKRHVSEQFTGTRRGEPLVLSSKTRVDRLGWNPNELNLTAATDRAEERVCALLGIPAAIVGFHAGLEQTKVGASMTELRRLAWNNGIVPVQDDFAEEIERSLLPDFRRAGRGTHRVRFDRTDVQALAEDANAIYERASKGVEAGWLTVAEAKRQVGIEPETGDDVYLRRIATVPVPAGTQPTPQRPEATEATEQRGQSASATKQADDDLDDDLRGEVEHQTHTRFEIGIAQRTRNGQRAEASEAQQAFMAINDRKRPSLERAMVDDLGEFFRDLGDRAERAAPEILEAMGFAKQSPEDAITVQRVVEAMALVDQVAVFREVYERHYLRVANEAGEAFEALGLATDIPDPVGRSVIATGGRRAGLVDLSTQTKNALFAALEEGRAEGEGVGQLAKRMRGIVSRGPWSSVGVRSMVIARTETKHAQNVATIAQAREQAVDAFRVFDARLGPTDVVCESLDGAVVSPDEADQLAFDEHPNGTRSFTPHFLPVDE